MSRDLALARRQNLVIRPEYDDEQNELRAKMGRRVCECRSPLAERSEDGEASCLWCGRPVGVRRAAA